MGVITVDIRSRTPIYEQLCENIKRCVLTGQITPGSQLPSVRALAGELAINPNTIQKAYAELERQGIISSLPGRGSFVPDDIGNLFDIDRRRILTSLEKSLVEARDAGIEQRTASDLIETVWKGESK